MLKRPPPPPPPLLRPRRRTGRLVLAGFTLLLGGAAGGLVLGLSLRPPVPPATAVQTALMPAEPPPARPDPRADQAAGRNGLLAEVEALRRAVTAEQSRLDSVVEARMAAEAQLAQAQRDPAAPAARRDAAVPAAPAPPRPPQPQPSPRPEPVAAPAAASQPRIVLHHRAGSTAAAEAAAELAATVRASGLGIEDVRTASTVPSQRVVRYFHSEDAPAAARLAGRLGRGWAIQDFRAYEPSPPPGTLDVWLPER